MGYNCRIMLKRLAMFAVLLMIVPALAPVPGWASTPSGNGGGNANNQGQNKNGHSAPSASMGKPPKAPESAKPADVPAGNNDEHSVKLTSLPPVTILDKEKTFWNYFFDWGPWAFGLVLAVAGVWQLILLRVTWKTIQAQKEEMAAQTQILRDSVAAARGQVQITKESERARLGIRTIDAPEVSGPEIILNGKCPLRVCVFVENLGRSKAFNVKAYGALIILPCPTAEAPEAGFLQVFPQIIDDGMGKHPLKLGGVGREFEDFTSTTDFLAIPKETVQDLRDGNAFVHVCGMLSYDDIFGDSHTAPFRFIWKSVGDDDGRKWLTRSFWMDMSSRGT